jgi:hypothetical protein
MDAADSEDGRIMRYVAVVLALLAACNPYRGNPDGIQGEAVWQARQEICAAARTGAPLVPDAAMGMAIFDYENKQWDDDDCVIRPKAGQINRLLNVRPTGPDWS